MSRRFCFALDLKDDPALIAEYRKYHEKIWPEITQSLKDSGIEDLEIYLRGISPLSEYEQERILGKTATEVYRL